MKKKRLPHHVRNRLIKGFREPTVYLVLPYVHKNEALHWNRGNAIMGTPSRNNDPSFASSCQLLIAPLKGLSPQRISSIYMRFFLSWASLNQVKTAAVRTTKKLQLKINSFRINLMPTFLKKFCFKSGVNIKSVSWQLSTNKKAKIKTP